MSQNLPPAGWYPDSSMVNTVRYWDGLEWTDDVAPASGKTPLNNSVPQNKVGADPSDPMHWLVPTGRSGVAIAAGYLGLVSLFLVFLGPVAILFGILGLRSADKNGTHGRGRAWFGIIAGIFGTVVTGYLLLS